MRAKCIRDCQEEEEIEMKMVIIDIIQGLLEGQGKKTQVFDKVLSVLHIDIMLMTCSIPKPVGAADGGDAEEVGGGDVSNSGEAKRSDAGKDEPNEDMIALQAECLVLFETLCDYKKSLRREIEIPESMLENRSIVASIELVWMGQLQRRSVTHTHTYKNIYVYVCVCIFFK
jgi:hypothetical protein